MLFCRGQPRSIVLTPERGTLLHIQSDWGLCHSRGKGVVAPCWRGKVATCERSCTFQCWFVVGSHIPLRLLMIQVSTRAREANSRWSRPVAVLPGSTLLE